MKWFKHQSDMRYDTKIRRLINKFGVAGYGVYNFILEAITQRLDIDSPIPDLEDTSADVAEYLGMDTLKVEEIILFCMNQGLFEQSETTGRIICSKIYKYIDKASTRSKEIRTMIENYNKDRDCPRLSETNTDKVDRIEENRIEKNIDDTIPKRNRFTPPTVEEVLEYCRERNNGIDAQRFVDFYSSKGWMVGKSKMKDWKASIRTWEKNSKSQAKQEQAVDYMKGVKPV